MRWVFVVAMLALPSVAGAPTTLYAHQVGSDFVLQVKAPPSDFAATWPMGVLPTLTCAPEVGTGLSRSDHHVWYGVVGPEAVEYGESGPRLHHERGLAFDLRLDPGAPAVFHWYMATQTVQDVSVGLPLPMVVNVTIREGDDVSVGYERFNAGRLVADGSSQPVWMGPAVGAAEVYHFEVPLTLHADFVGWRESFNVRVDARLDAALCEDDKLAPSYAPYTGPDHRPRLEWAAVEPVRIVTMEETRSGSELFLDAGIEATFGRQQLVETSAILTGPGGEVTLEAIQRPPAYHGHGPIEPFRFGWLATALAPGDYTWTVTAMGPGTEPVVQSKVVTMPADAEAPFVPVLAVAALLLGLAWRRQRRS